MATKRLLLVNGPNLNLLGTREPDVYGERTLADVEAVVTRAAAEEGLDVRALQSNHEGVLIDAIHEARQDCDAVVVNPGGLTHTSVSLRDALTATGLPFAEVHVTDVTAREGFRRRSYLSDVASVVVSGEGVEGYATAVHRLAATLFRKESELVNESARPGEGVAPRAVPVTTEADLAPQAEISDEIEKIHADASGRETQPRLDFPPYRSSLLRHPTKDLRHADPEGCELVAPVFGHSDVDALESDLTIQSGGEPLGERILVRGRILDAQGRPVRNQLVEIWQANAAGRYIHKRDQHRAPIDPNFTGVGRCLTDGDGGYRFTTIKPGPYPWRNHRNAWRPAHIHFSLFGTDFTQRMITQMYFPGDPLFALDPIYQAITDQGARDRLVANYDHDLSEHEWLLGYRWDIVLTGSHATPLETEDDHV